MGRRLESIVAFFMLIGLGLAQAQKPVSYENLSNAENRFAIKFFRQAVQQRPRQNVLTAPIGMLFNFALLQNGADPKTRDEIRTVFEFPNLPEELNEQSLALRDALCYPSSIQPPRSSARLEKYAPPPLSEPSADDRLIFAGSLWLTNRVRLQTGFMEVNDKFYHFHTGTLGQGRAAGDEVNSWIAQTGGRLKLALDSWHEDDFQIVDISSFTAAWSHPFQLSQTRMGNFFLLSGDKKEVPMMRQVGSFAYMRRAKFQGIRLPYHRAAMYIFLPDENSSIEELLHSLSPDNWAAWMRDFDVRDGYVELPRFRSEYEGDVRPILQQLGINRAFTNLESFVPAFGTAGGAVSRVFQSITVNIDEEGTEVASLGVTAGIVGGVPGGHRPEPFRMIVNRPFFFAVVDNGTKALLYMGAVLVP